jgi:hypothetical protein
MPWRYDLGSLRPARRLADGRVICDAFISRSGVFEYLSEDGSLRREYRPPEEVFHPDALSSFALVPVTNDHPPERLSSKNVRKYVVGATGESPHRDGIHVRTQLSVFDSETIQRMDAGKVELSCGYFVDVFDEPGISPDGERFDVIQRNIRGNNGGHVAIVESGRAGPTVHARMDSPPVVRWDSATMTNNRGTNTPIETITTTDLGDISMTLEELQKKLTDALTQVSELTVKCDECTRVLKTMTGERDTEKKRADTAEASRDDLQVKLDTSVKALKDRIDSEGERIQSRVDLLAQASRVMVDAKGKLDTTVKLTEMTDRQVKETVIKKISGDAVKLDGKSDDYIDARYETALEGYGSGRSAHDDVRRTLVDGGREREENVDSDPEIAAKQARLRAQSQQWKTPMRPLPIEKGGV